MGAFLVRRLASLILVLLALTAAMFALQRISPVDPVRAALGPNTTKQVVDAARSRLGYDDPLPVQYVRYVRDAAGGNLQISLRTGQPVLTDIRTALPASIELVLAAMVLAVPIALMFGLGGAVGHRGAGALRLATMVLAAAPPFVLGLLGILLFYKQLGWLPASGRSAIADAPTGPTGLLTVDSLLAGRPNVWVDAVQHLVLPALCLALIPGVAVGRVLRGALLTNLRADHVQVARSKGLTETQVVLRHCLRNAAGPSLAMSGLMVGVVFSGLAIVETVFAWPGLGLYVNESIPRGDFPAIAGTTLLLGLTYVVVNAAIDILQTIADPRIRR